jgi:hypothetical protein
MRWTVSTISVFAITTIAAVLGLLGPVVVTGLWLWNEHSILRLSPLVRALWPTQLLMLATHRGDTVTTVIVWWVSAISNIIIYAAVGFLVGTLLKVGGRVAARIGK